VAWRDPPDEVHDLVDEVLNGQNAGHRHHEEQRGKQREERVIRQRRRPPEALATVELAARAPNNHRPAEGNRKLREQDHVLESMLIGLSSPGTRLSTTRKSSTFLTATSVRPLHVREILRPTLCDCAHQTRRV